MSIGRAIYDLIEIYCSKLVKSKNYFKFKKKLICSNIISSGTPNPVCLMLASSSMIIDEGLAHRMMIWSLNK